MYICTFEDLENVSEMVAETSEASKAKVLPVKTTRARARARARARVAKVLSVKTTRARARAEFAI